MKVVHSWLNELAPLGDDATQLAAAMTQLGMAVEEIAHVGGSVAGVVTARVVRTERHPEAAKVHRVFVDTGDGVERHVWCGAFNMSPGDVIPLATPGTTMPDGRLIEPRPILGINSDGMLCSALELGLGNDHTGILVLPPGTPLGVPYGDALDITEETVFDLDLTRNRPDCWGHLGVARDVAAHLGVALLERPVAPVADGVQRVAAVELVDGGCARFTSTVVSGIRVVPSPDWLARRLAAAGMRPINNVVDASNAVMLELNQPNHAYDIDTLGGSGFLVRNAHAGEGITTLDGVDRILTTSDLLVCDATDTPIGIAGIMGGLDSEISASTTAVVLEVAWFDPSGIQQTAVRLGLRSEASARFERGVDPYGMPAAAGRFVELLRLTCPALVVHVGGVDARSEQLPPEVVTVLVRPQRVNAVIAGALTAEEMAGLLDPIGFRSSIDDGLLHVDIPSWRPDSTSEIDVVEEIARHAGYDSIVKRVPSSTMHGRLSAAQARRRRVRAVLLGFGLSEAMPNPFLAPVDLARAGLAGPVVHIVNPLAAEESVLRTSLRPGLLKALAFNESHRRSGVGLFEIGHVYPPGDGALPDEYESLGVVMAGRDATEAMRLWRELAAALGFGARVDQGAVPPGTHPTRSATLSVGRDVVGVVGEVHPDALDAFGVTERVAVLELDLTRLLGTEPKPSVWKATSRFPSSDLDLAFSVPVGIAAERVEKAIKQAAGNVLVDLALFDVYRGEGVPEGLRSLAYRLRLQASDRTLADDELTALRAKIVAATTKVGAQLRS
jgi:phenylalanyl-tRNA synthetase beta chain